MGICHECRVLVNGHRLNVHLVALPVYFVLLAMFSIGIAYFVAALSVYMTDLAQAVPIVLTTHDTQEGRMAGALAAIAALDSCLEPPRMIRIEQL